MATSLGEATRSGASCVKLVLKPDPSGGPTDLTCMNIMCEQVGGPCVCKLARALSRLPRLERLDVSGHKLGVLPDTIGELESLTHLDVSGNDLRDLSMIERPPPKRDVWGREVGTDGVDNSEEEEAEPAAGGLKRLVSLRADDNRLTSLDLRRLTALREVSLRNNGLDAAPLLPPASGNDSDADADADGSAEVTVDLEGNPLLIGDRGGVV